MKQKKARKKLGLSKETIARLNDGESKKVYGGIPAPQSWTCNGPGTRCGSSPCC